MWGLRAAACRHNANIIEAVDQILSIRHSKSRQSPAKRDFIEKTSSNSNSVSVSVSGNSNSNSNNGSCDVMSRRLGCGGNVRVVQQVWSLLASSIEVMAHRLKESDLSPSSSSSSTSTPSFSSSSFSSSSSSSSIGQSDSMPMGDGSDFNWSQSVLGRSLLCRCVNLLQKNGDLQTLATVVCIFGGSDQLVALMAHGKRKESNRE